MMQANTIYITPNAYKQNVLLQKSQDCKLNQDIFMTLEELIEKITFEITPMALYELIKEYHFSYSIAKMYLNNIRYVYDVKTSQHPNIQKLIELKQELESKKLLKTDPIFKQYIKGKKLEVRGYILTKEEKKFLHSLENITTVDVIEDKPKKYTHTVYGLETIDEEVAYIAADIARRLHNGNAIDKIFLTNVTEEYAIPLHRIFRMFQIPLEEQNKHTLYGNALVQKWLDTIASCEDKEESIQKIDVPTEPLELKLYEEFIKICNQYVMLPKDEIWFTCILEACKYQTLPPTKLKSAIHIKDVRKDLFEEDDIVYVLGMNQENIPRVYQDENYLNDTCCTMLEIDTTKDKNDYERNLVIQKINAIPNAILTYKKKTPFGSYYRSSILDLLDCKEEKPENISYQYSDDWNQISLAKQMDQYIEYNEKGAMLDLLYAHYPDFSYRTYDNQYQPIDVNHLHDYLNQKLLLSYTSLDNYNRCGFRYYMSNILKVEAYQETFAQKIGNLFHYFLSIAFTPSFDFEQEWKNYHQEREYTAKERFFLKKLKQELLFVIQTIQEQNKYTSLTKEKYEQKIFTSITGNIKITFMGIVDKIKYKEEDGVIYAAIIDYKTGTLETNLNQSIYGIGMQLPIYLYLVKNQPGWKSVQVLGFYLQKMIQNEINNDDNEDYEKLKKDNMRLEGYSINQMDLLEKLDSTYMDSQMIKSLKVGKNGFYAYSKILSDTQMNKLLHLTQQQIEQAAHQIEQADFCINPKQIGQKLVGCEFCKYQDLCFKTPKDIVHLKEYKNLEFLEGGSL